MGECTARKCGRDSISPMLGAQRLPLAELNLGNNRQLLFIDGLKT